MTRMVIVLAALALAAGCTAAPPVASSDAPARREAPPAASEWFTDEAEAAGLHFIHDNGMSGEYFFPEIMGSGAAVLDYDNDGDLDVFLVQGRVVAGSSSRLFRNDLAIGPDRTRTLRFTDVTKASGIDAREYGMGVAAGDVTNDGCVDLYLTHVGPNQLFRNNCDGTFTDVSRQSGVADEGWGVSASFLDYDRDGWLDLYVGNYVHYSIAADVRCPGVAGGRDYCPPRTYRAQPDRLFRNLGNGTFADVTARALTGGHFGPALGVSSADFNGDGWIDIYVANDGEANLLWTNQRDGTFRNTALLAGAAFNADGRAQASMGVDAGDFNGDGFEDLVAANLTGEATILYVNDGTGMFEDQTARAGLRAASLPYTGFGAAWIDIDNDGWLDLLTVNGTVVQHQGRAGGIFPYDQRKQLFRNLGTGRFEDATDRAGAVFRLSEVGRGAAFGDVNNDGTTDVVVANANGPARLLINHAGRRHHWAGLRLVGSGGMPRDMLGARVAIRRADGTTLWRRARADGSYASANDPRVLAGLGTSDQAPDVRVLWPSGRTEEWTAVAIDRWTTLREGGGT